MADILTRLGDVQLDTGHALSALQSYQRMQKFLERRAVDFPSDDAQSDVSSAHSHVGESQAALGDLLGAIESYRRALLLIEPLVKKHPTNQSYLRFLRVDHTWLGHLTGNPLYINQANKMIAIEHFRKAVAIAEEMNRIDPKNARARQDLAIDCGNLADLLSDSDPGQAAELHRKALGITYALLELTPDEFIFLRRKAYFLRGLAGDLKKLQDYQSALQVLLRARQTLQGLLVRDPSNTQIQRDLQVTTSRLGDVLIDTGDFDGALDNFRRILSLAENWAMARPFDLYAQWQLADSYANLGNYYVTIASHKSTPTDKRIESWKKTRDWYRESLNVWDDWPNRAASTSFHAMQHQRMVRAIAKCDDALTN